MLSPLRVLIDSHSKGCSDLAKILRDDDDDDDDNHNNDNDNDNDNDNNNDNNNNDICSYNLKVLIKRCSSFELSWHYDQRNK